MVLMELDTCFSERWTPLATVSNLMSGLRYFFSEMIHLFMRLKDSSFIKRSSSLTLIAGGVGAPLHLLHAIYAMLKIIKDRIKNSISILWQSKFYLNRLPKRFFTIWGYTSFLQLLQMVKPLFRYTSLYYTVLKRLLL